MEKVIGIDLGTTNSCVAIFTGAGPHVVSDSEGMRTTPSVVAFTEDGERLIGVPARRQAVTNPAHTFFAIKRLMGRRFDDPLIARDAKLLPYRIAKGPTGNACVETRGNRYSPEEISAFILQKMKEIAETYLGHGINDAVIAVPAHFGDIQRHATRSAARIAGLNVLLIANEPSAAALAYSLDDTQASRTVAVYDLGGGTFDISVLEISEGVITVKSTNGDPFLGGEDLDLRLVDYLATQFQKETRIDLRTDALALQRLKEAAEDAKIELSRAQRVAINLPFIAADQSGPKQFMTTLSRMQLESLVEDLILKTLPPSQQALDDAGLKPADIDEVVLVGGMTRMPKVQQLVKQFFGKEPQQGVNPVEVVAVGAALQAALITGAIKNTVFLDQPRRASPVA